MLVVLFYIFDFDFCVVFDQNLYLEKIAEIQNFWNWYWVLYQRVAADVRMVVLMLDIIDFDVVCAFERFLWFSSGAQLFFHPFHLARPTFFLIEKLCNFFFFFVSLSAATWNLGLPHVRQFYCYLYSFFVRFCLHLIFVHCVLLYLLYR